MSRLAVFSSIDLLARATALALAALAGLVAATHWAVRRRALHPFGWWPRTVRQLSDPVLRPIEGRLVRAGQSPQAATLWLLGLTLVAGLVLVSLVRWFLGSLDQLLRLGQVSGRVQAAMGVAIGFGVLKLALVVRVVASWLGASSSAWLRPLGLLTDWLIRPIRRVVPPIGLIDWAPLAGYLVLAVAESVLVPLVAGG